MLLGPPWRSEANAIDVPVLARFSLTSGTGASPYLLAGPKLSFETSIDEEFLGMQEDVSDDVKNTDVSVVLGAGIAFPIGESALDVEARYAWGVKKLDEEGIIDAKSRAFVFLLGLRF